MNNDWKASSGQRQDALTRAFEQLDHGNIAAAEIALRDLIKGMPPNAMIKHLEARILEAKGQLAEAAKSYEAACNMEDAAHTSFVKLAELLHQAGNDFQAREILRFAFKKFPQEPSVSAKLGLALFHEGHVNQARRLVNYALKIGALDLATCEAAGTFFRVSGSPVAAVDYLQTALELAKKLPGANGRKKYCSLSLFLAETLKDCGDMKSAESTLRAVLRKDSTNSRAWLMLSDLIRFKANTPEIKKMSRLHSKPEGMLTTSDKIDLGFALGKAWMDAGDPALAMEYLLKANHLHRSRLRYEVLAACRRLENYANCIRDVGFIKSFSASNTPEKCGASPLFIVGMPRSGTTLLEQILATHPKVFGADELMTLPRLKNTVFGRDFPDAIDSKDRVMSQERLSKFAELYINESRQYLDQPPSKYRYLIDKQPGNFMFCGLIILAFSHAKIIHCRRNPIDTCLSCFSKYFVSGQSFTYDLTELGKYYRAYENLMAHWRNVLPEDRFLEVQYEDIVANLEPEARRIVDFLGMDWNPEILNFHDTRRSVRTASASQVRQPIYNSSVERWRPYEKELAPLFEALDIKPD